MVKILWSKMHLFRIHMYPPSQFLSSRKTWLTNVHNKRGMKTLQELLLLFSVTLWLPITFVGYLYEFINLPIFVLVYVLVLFFSLVFAITCFSKKRPKITNNITLFNITMQNSTSFAIGLYSKPRIDLVVSLLAPICQCQNHNLATVKCSRGIHPFQIWNKKLAVLILLTSLGLL